MRKLQFRLPAILIVLSFLLPIPAAQADPALAAPRSTGNAMTSLAQPDDSEIVSISAPSRDNNERPAQNPEPIRREFIPPTPEQLALTKAQVASFDCSTVTDVPQIECEALVALYNSTNGAGWWYKLNWLETTTVGNWYGVSVTSGRISHIDLLADNLTGNIPSALGILTNLIYLGLNHNQITGVIPSFLGNLTNLWSLSLNDNFLTGSIPPELGGMTNLEQLNLYRNQLSGSIPASLGNLSKLRYLELWSNNLTGSIPSSLGGIPWLRRINLSNNQLSGSIPPELSIPPLEVLDLSNNQLVGILPPELGSLIYLEHLYLQGNLFAGSIPLTFINLLDLGIFHFYDTSLCEPITPEYLAWKESISDYQGTGRLCPPPTGYQQKFLFVPLNWSGSQIEFESTATTQVNLFIDEVPLSGCRNQVLIEFLDVETQNFDTFTCTVNPLNDIRGFVKNNTNYNPDDWDVVIGLAETSPCPPTAGQSNGANTIWVTTSSTIVTAHELGHIFGLEDQYCSNQAGSTDARCNDGDIQNDGPLTGDFNWLSPIMPFNCPPDGSEDSTGAKCCNYNSLHLCSSKAYGICCRGNFNSSGGRSTMSYADAPGPRGFDDIELAYLGNLPELQCKSSSILSGGVTPQTDFLGNTRILDINLMVQSDDTVESRGISITTGRPTQESVLASLSGDYQLSILDKDGSEIFLQPFSLYFDYFGPVFDEEDYSTIGYNEQDFSLRLPYSCAMKTLVLYHAGEEIFSQELPTICDIFIPILRK